MGLQQTKITITKEMFCTHFNVLKNYFTTAAKDYLAFADPNLEGLGMSVAVLQAWHEMNQTGSSVGKEPLETSRHAYRGMKARVSNTLRYARKWPYGVRQEYRVTWDLFWRLRAPPAHRRPHALQRGLCGTPSSVLDAPDRGLEYSLS